MEKIYSFLRARSVSILRISLGIVFLWFGGLKLAGASPVAALIGSTYSFVPLEEFMLLLGGLEVLVGLGLILRIALRATIIVLLGQMAGTLFSAVLNPGYFFVSGNPLLLTLEGEFLAKNLILISAALVIAGHDRD